MKNNAIIIVFASIISIFSTTNSIAGLIDVSKIVITPSSLNTQGWLQVSEVVALETGTGNDLALTSAGATASGSSNWPGSSPNNSINGIAPASFPNIFHSNENNGSSFLNIVLASASELDSITLFGRTDCCSFRDIYNLDIYNDADELLFSATDLNATGLTHSVFIELPDTAVSVPEPTSIALLGLGLIGLSIARKKKLS